MEMEGPQTYKFVLSGPDMETQTISADVVFTYDNAELIASGTPDDITFAYAMDGFAFAVQNLNLSAVEANDSVEFTLTGTGSALKGTSHLSQGDLITLAGESNFSGFGYSFQGRDVNGAVSSTNATYGEMVTKSAITLPTGGMSTMNLAAALHDGLSIEATGSYGSSETRTTVLVDGEQVSSQAMTAGSSTSDLSANADAIKLTANGSEIGMDAIINVGMPLSLHLDVDQMAMDFGMPVSASDEPQDFTMALGFNGLELGNDIWAMFDPTETLPRDPAALSVDLTGQATLLQDLMNFAEMSELAEGNLPIELNTLTIKNFLISAVGASLSGTGDFAFNNNDLVSFDGMPAPSGTADLKITGANGLIDKLIEMGFVQESDAMGARMMMGMFAVPGEGEDSIKSNLEITKDGKILANGQRIK